MDRGRTSRRAFFCASVLLFVAGVASTVGLRDSMPSICATSMSGGSPVSMAWMPMPGQRWLGASASLLGMWVAMMAAMMTPSLAPMLWRYRQAVRGTGATRLASLVALVGTGYFVVWEGAASFPLPAGAGA